MKHQTRTRSGRIAAARAVGVLAALMALAWAMPSEAARVLDLRVGRHPDFTRVVLELDAPAGYKIERAEPKPGVSELIVSLEATGKPQRLAGGNRQIQSVSLEPAGPGASTVRIRLAREGLRLKEMILAGPPRIVLDVLGGQPETRTAASTAKAKPTPKPAAKPAAKTSASAPAAAPAPKPAARAAAKAGTAPSAAPDLEPAAEKSRPSGGPAARPLAEPRPVPAPSPGAGLQPSPKAEPMAAEPTHSAAGPQRPAGTIVRGAPAGSLEPESGEPTQVAMAEPGAPKDRPPASRPANAPAEYPPGARPVPTPPSRRPEPSTSGSLFSLQNMALAAGAVVLVAGGLMLMRRRRSAGGIEGAEEEGLGDANPFEGFGEGLSADRSGSTDATATATFLDEDEDTSGGDELGSDDSKETSLFDVAVDRSAAQGVEMQTAASGFETMGTETAVGDDVMRLIRELERRVTSLESRLDEAVDAKERLERQVAAQTEELRVQRAAIARTQRAVRNLTRTDDEGATEPARREV